MHVTDLVTICNDVCKRLLSLIIDKDTKTERNVSIKYIDRCVLQSEELKEISVTKELHERRKLVYDLSLEFERRNSEHSLTLARGLPFQ